MADIEEDDKFNFDMLMHEPRYYIDSIIQENQQKNDIRVKSTLQPFQRIRTKKGKKLILRKKKEKSKNGLILGKIERDTNESKTYECHHPACEKVFMDKNSYRKHLITHGEKQV